MPLTRIDATERGAYWHTQDQNPMDVVYAVEDAARVLAIEWCIIGVRDTCWFQNGGCNKKEIGTGHPIFMAISFGAREPE